MPNNIPEYLTAAEVQKLLGGISRVTLWRHVRDDKLPAPLKLGRRVLWVRAEIDAALQELPRSRAAA